MSGLAAVFSRDGRPIDREAIWRMLDAIPYRGPDGMFAWSSEELVLGHARMAITPEEETERQPIVSPRTGCVIAADVRLDNREYILAQLPGRLPTTVSDADLMLRAYETWGMDSLPRLLGDFAFILWDPRIRRLICARDTSGQRMLFYRADGATFAAASEIQQLLQDPSIPIRPNDAHIRERLVPRNVYLNEKDAPTTYYEGIYAVPAGHVLTVNSDAVRLTRYWELRRPPELRYRRDEEYAEHFRTLFFDVVRPRLRSSRPLGILLSGGLDSSSIAGAAQQLYRAGAARDEGFQSFSFVFDGLDCDERLFVQDLQAQYDFPSHYVSPGEYSGRLQLDPLGFREAPNMGIAQTRDAMFGGAAGRGVRALLSGDMGDSCVYGSRLVLDSLLRRGDLGAFMRHLRAYRRVSDESSQKVLGLYCLAPLLPLSLQRPAVSAYLRHTFGKVEPYLLPLWMPPALRSELAHHHLDVSLQIERSRLFSNDTRESEYRLLYPPEIARHPVPWPIEVWRPFADRRLHDFVLAIPPDQKFSPHPETDDYYAGSKQILRRAMRGILPESIRTRTTKTVFYGVWEKEIERNWDTFEAAFGPSAQPEIAVRGYVDQAQFWARLQQMRAGEQTADQIYIFKMVSLETWLRSFRQPRESLVTVRVPVSHGDGAVERREVHSAR